MAAEGTARLRREAGGVSRRSATRAGIFLGVALLAAAGTAFALSRYMDARMRGAVVKTHKVVVAQGQLAVATTLRQENLSTIDWPAGSEPSGSFADPQALEGRVLLTKLEKGEPILTSKLASKEAGMGLAAVLPSDMRAVAVRVDDVVGVAGFIHPGDSVDVIVTMKPTEQTDSPPTAKMILQNVKVLAVGKQLDADEKNARKAVEATVATLMVDSEQAEKLALAASKGKLLLALRSSLDTRLVATPGSIPPTLLSDPKAPMDPAPPRPERQVKATGRVVTAPAAKRDVVEILRGDHFEERAFDGKGGGQ